METSIARLHADDDSFHDVLAAVQRCAQEATAALAAASPARVALTGYGWAPERADAGLPPDRSELRIDVGPHVTVASLTLTCRRPALFGAHRGAPRYKLDIKRDFPSELCAEVPAFGAAWAGLDPFRTDWMDIGREYKFNYGSIVNVGGGYGSAEEILTLVQRLVTALPADLGARLTETDWPHDPSPQSRPQRALLRVDAAGIPLLWVRMWADKPTKIRRYSVNADRSFRDTLFVAGTRPYNDWYTLHDLCSSNPNSGV